MNTQSTAKLINTCLDTGCDFSTLTPEEIDAVCAAEYNNEDVTVVAQPMTGYFTVVLADGTKIESLSGHHINIVS